MTVRARKLLVAPVFLGLLGLAGWLGCSASNEEDGSSGFGNPSSGSGNAPGTGGNAGEASGGTGEGGSGAGLNLGGSTGQGGSETCVETPAEAGQVQLDVIVVQDKSASMSGSYWNGTTAALSEFVDDPASAGINIGIVYFPVDAPDDCVVDDYKNVLAYGPLPDNAQTFKDSLNAENPDGSATPMWGALYGALFAATGLQTAYPDHKVIVVLSTDGQPTSCDETDIGAIAGLAEAAYNYNGVQTYAIAITASIKADLDVIASKGGTTEAFDVSANINTFAEKMAQIRIAALGCEIVIPPPPENEELDPDLVNVNYYPNGETADLEKIPRKDNKSECGPSGGWYYDDPKDPTKIIFCPSTCEEIQADGGAKVDVGFGCKTIAE